jgi:hypothetical protein
MAYPEDDAPVNDTKTDEQTQTTEDLRDLEPERDVKGGRPVFM